MPKDPSQFVAINQYQRGYYRKSSAKYMGNSDPWTVKGFLDKKHKKQEGATPKKKLLNS
jgi:hypothetical protein